MNDSAATDDKLLKVVIFARIVADLYQYDHMCLVPCAWWTE